MDLTGHNKLVDNINCFISKALREKGYSRVNRIWDGSLFVYSAFEKDKKRLIKFPSYESFDKRSYNKEISFLKRLSRLEGITHLLGELNFSFSSKYVQPIALIKEYAKGNPYSGQYLSTKQEQNTIDTIKEIHKEGIVDLDIKLNNYIYFPNKGLTFIDPIYDETLNLLEVDSAKEKERLKKLDLESIEKIFEFAKGLCSWN
jgi:hypothetical protein